MIRSGFIGLCLIVFLLTGLKAQENFIMDTIRLDEVSISAKDASSQEVLKSEHIDSMIISLSVQENLATLLQANTPLFIKNYGPGSIATSSFRGAGATHTQVYWNGLNINSPMLGQVDFSQLPVFMLDQLDVLYGGSSLTEGSGALGGSVVMSNKANWQSEECVRFLQSVASFSNLQSMASVRLKSDKWLSETRIAYESSENDFPYKNNARSLTDPPEEIRTDADRKSISAMQAFYFRPDSKQQLSIKAWFQKEDRHIPPPITVRPISGNEQQEHSFLRSVADYEKFYQNGKFSGSIGYVFDYMNYRNKVAGIESINKVHSVFGRVKNEYQLQANIEFSIGLDFQQHIVQSNNYEEDKSRSLFSAIAGFSYHPHSRIDFMLMARAETASGFFPFVSPSLGIKYHLIRENKLSLRLNINKNTHLPNLNDLYWIPGGNAGLQAESGWMEEIGVDASILQSPILDIGFSASGFMSTITNRIQWRPDSVFSYWTPVNISEVHTTGIEASANIKFHSFFGDVELRPAYTFTKALDEQDMQLIYTPEQSWRLFVHYSFKRFTAFYSLDHTGASYTTTDNLRRMLPFTLHDAGVNYTIKRERFNIGLNFRLNNILNTSYQVVAWQPMPGRNFRIGLNLTLKSRKK